MDARAIMYPMAQRRVAKKGAKKVQFSIYMDASLKAELESLASARGMTLSQFLETIGRKYYEHVPGEILHQIQHIRKTLGDIEDDVTTQAGVPPDKVTQSDFPEAETQGENQETAQDNPPHPRRAVGRTR